MRCARERCRGEISCECDCRYYMFTVLTFMCRRFFDSAFDKLHGGESRAAEEGVRTVGGQDGDMVGGPEGARGSDVGFAALYPSSTSIAGAAVSVADVTVFACASPLPSSTRTPVAPPPLPTTPSPSPRGCLARHYRSANPLV
jgi:hypothetical protein